MHFGPRASPPPTGPMHKKRVYLHVGNFKTGTSAIQKFCSENRLSLIEAGVDYIAAARPAANPTNHGKLALSLYRKYDRRVPAWYSDGDDFNEVADSLRRAMDASECDTLVISTEELYRIPGFPEKVSSGIGSDLRRLFATYDLRVIMYVRAPMDFACSWYNEINKAHKPRRRFIDFIYRLEPNLLLPEDNAAYWRSLFGRECLHLEPYVLRGNAHLRRFLELLDIGQFENLPESEQRVNPMRDESSLERDRLEKIMALQDTEQRSRMLRSQALASVENFRKLQEKVNMIGSQFDLFCEREEIVVPGGKFRLEEMLVHDERVNRRDIVGVNPLRVLGYRCRQSAVGTFAKQVRDVLRKRVGN